MAGFNFTTRRIEWEEINLPNGQVKHIEKSRTFTNWIVSIYPKDNGKISITRDGETRTYKVTEDYEFCYKVQKTQIRAINGAEGLFNLIDREVTREFPKYEDSAIPESLYIINVLPYIWKTCKPLQ